VSEHSRVAISTSESDFGGCLIIFCPRERVLI
jgi:hypothetical protein